MTSSRRLRIAWLTNAPSADQIDLFTALALRPEIDFNVIYCSPHSVKGEIESSAPYGRGVSLQGSRLPRADGGFFLNPSIILLLARSCYDILIISGYAHPTMQLAMMVRAVQRRPWLLFAERPGMVQNYWHSFGRRIAMFMVRSADGIIATGRLAKESFALQLGSSADVFSVPYLVNHTDFLRLRRPRNTTNRISFMACAALIPRKGIDVLIKAFQQAAQANPDFSLTIVGDGPEREPLEESVTDECRDRITFRGAIPFTERAKVFGEADVFIHPARHDGWGVVIHEALAAGMPVIATRETGAAYELLEDGSNGFLIDAEDEAGLVERILWFVNHRNEIERFSHRARAAVSGLTPEWGAAELVRITQSISRARDL